MVWLAAVVAPSAQALPSDDCTLTLTLGDGSGSATTDMVGGVVALYRVAGVTDDHTAYDPTQGQFPRSAVAQSAATLDQKELDAQNASIAKELVRQAKAGDIDALVQQGVRNGSVRFESLDEGLYLVVQTKLSNGGRKITPFLVSLPDASGSLDVVALPKHGTMTEDGSDGDEGGKDSQEDEGTTTEDDPDGDGDDDDHQGPDKDDDTADDGDDSGEADDDDGSSSDPSSNIDPTASDGLTTGFSRLPSSGDASLRGLALLSMAGACFCVLGLLIRGNDDR